MFTWLSVLLSRIRAPLHRRRIDADFESEVGVHLDLLIEENMRRGMNRDEAQRMARIALGGITQLKERNRERSGVPHLEILVQDLRYAARMLLRSPGFSGIALLTLALGIGVNTTLFTAVNAIALKTLPVRDAGSIVRLERWFESGNRGNGQYAYSYAEYVFLRDHNQVFSHLIAASFLFPSAAAPGPAPGRSRNSFPVHGQLVSGEYFSELGANTIAGRTFLPEENETPGAHSVVVLSHFFWQRAFNSDPNIVGKTIVLNGALFNIVGVTRSDFIGTGNPPQVPDFWAPLMLEGHGLPVIHDYQLLGRLKSGVVLAQAQAAINVLGRQFEKENPADDRTTSITLERATLFGETNDIRFQAFVALLMIIVGMVLLIACANIANMLLARAGARSKEIAVRLALGASRRRVVRQLLTESILLGLCGGAAGL